MKKHYSLSILVCILFSFTVHAQIWQPVGPDDNNQPSFFPGVNVSMALNSTGIPYIAFRDEDINGHKATVRKFDGGIWTNVGIPSFSEGAIYIPDIAFDHNNTPYVVYQDVAQGNKATVKKFDGVNWITVGTAGFSTGAITNVSLAIDGNNTPYVQYISGSGLYIHKFDGTNWVTVGTTGFPASWESSMAIDGANTPYIIYGDDSNMGKAIVKKFDGANWITAGVAGFSTNDIHIPSIAFNAINTPYVAFLDGNVTTVRRLSGTIWLTVGTTALQEQAQDISMALDVNGRPNVAYIDNNDGNVKIKGYTGTTWVAVGTSIVNYSGASVNRLSIAIDVNNTPYIAYNDYSLTNKAIVKKLNGTSWANLGIAGFTPGGAGYTTIKIDANNTPYVVYEDIPNDSKASVKKFDGSTWIDVGTPGFSNAAIDYPSLAFDATGTAYVVYKDRNTGKATVKKFDGSSWVDVGAPGFSTGSATYTSIAIDGNNTPYVVYRDAANSNKATVKKFDGSNWVTVGIDGFSTGAVAYTSIAINSSGMPYVAYLDVQGGVFNDGKITVKQFNGAGWVTVGPDGFSGTTRFASLTIDGNDIPYVAYADEDNGDNATVKRFNGIAWEDVGTPGFSGAIASNISIVVNTSGIPYISYSAESDQYRATVKKFNSGNWVTVGTEAFSAGYSEYLSMAIGPNAIPIVVYSSGDAFAKSIIETTLPLNFLAFKGQLLDNDALVTWKTDNETNTLAFIVERSIDGRIYSNVATVNALNKAGIHQYNFKDPNINLLGASVVYYRLKQKDRDGRHTNSRIVTLPMSKTESTVIVYPNPVTNEAGVKITVNKPETIQVRLIDNSGKILQSQVWNVSAGSHSLSIEMSGVAKGIYYLQVKGKDVNKQVRIAKQ